MDGSLKLRLEKNKTKTSAFLFKRRYFAVYKEYYSPPANVVLQAHLPRYTQCSRGGAAASGWGARGGEEGPILIL